jgi:hypothetical protein
VLLLPAVVLLADPARRQSDQFLSLARADGLQQHFLPLFVLIDFAQAFPGCQKLHWSFLEAEV